MTGVLIVEDGSGLSVLAAVRSLGRAGFRVGLGLPAGRGRSVRSRFVDRVHPVPAPETDHPGFLRAVRAAVREGRYAVVVGGDDIEMLALSAGREQLGALVPYAPHPTVLRAVDKLELTRAAERVGLAVPETVEPGNPAALPLPLIVKARLHWQPGSRATGRHLLVRLARTRAELADALAEIERSGGEALLQRPVDGTLMAQSLVLDPAGRLLAVSQQETTRLSLRSTSARAHTVPVDPALLDGVLRLLRELGWVGLANVQFLQRGGGRPALIDLNGRFYGSLALAVAAGADLPVVWVRSALGQPVDGVQTARPGVRFHSLQEDLLRAREQRRGGLLRDAAGVLGYAAVALPSRVRLDDPAPALAQLAAVVTVRRRSPPDGS